MFARPTATLALTAKRNRLFLSALLLLAGAVQGAWATDYITDVMLIGSASASDITTLRTSYEAQGWTFIEKDLNDGCGTGSDYIHLLYKTSTDASQAITAFYLQTGNTHPASQTRDGRTYYLTPYDGSDNFKTGYGDLNHKAGGDYIFLYYTKEAFAPARGVTSIVFNSTSAGALNGVNLNKGCGADTDDIYMHVVSNATANPIEVSTQSYLEEAATLNEAYIKLTGDVGIGSALELNYGVSVTLDLNSHNLNRGLSSATANGHAVKVNSGCTLTVTDSSGGATGTITGGYTTTNGGGIVNEGNLIVSGGTIGGNHAANGGGIYNTGTLTLRGGTVGSNEATTYGGGVYFASGTVQVQDAPVVSGNTVGGTANNVYLPSGKKVTVSGALASGAHISITPASTTDVLSTGYATQNPEADPNDFFFDDDTEYRYALLEGNIYRYEIVTSMESWYIKEDGTVMNQTGCRKMSALTDQAGVAIANGWYVVDGTCTFNNRITVLGTVHLILTDGTWLNADKGVRVPYGVNFHVWGQSDEDLSIMGILKADATSESGCAGIGGNKGSDSGNLYFHGGNSGGYGGENAAGIGGGAYGMMSGTITVSGGSISGFGGTGGEWPYGGAGIGSGSQGYVKGDIIITGGGVLGFGGNGGAGIGSGYDGWSYSRIDSYSEVPVESSSIRISGGTVFGGSVGGGAGIGGGVGVHPYHGCLGNLYITGGKVSAYASFTDLYGSRSAEAIGHGRMFNTDETYRGSFSIYNNAKVEATTSYETNATLTALSAGNRINVSDPNNDPTYKQVFISPCDHSDGATYTDNGNGTHTVSGCSWCSGETVAHTFIEGTCVCGAAAPAETWTVTVKTYDTATSAYDGTNYNVEQGSAYTLPACDDISGYEFAGWVADPASQANGCQPNDGETLLAAGHELTPSADVTFYARYRAIDLSLADNGDNRTVLASYYGKTAHSVHPQWPHALQGRRVEHADAALQPHRRTGDGTAGTRSPDDAQQRHPQRHHGGRPHWRRRCQGIRAELRRRDRNNDHGLHGFHG